MLCWRVLNGRLAIIRCLEKGTLFLHGINMCMIFQLFPSHIGGDDIRCFPHAIHIFCQLAYRCHISGQRILVQMCVLFDPCVAHCLCDRILSRKFPGDHIIKPCQDSGGMPVRIANGMFLLNELTDNVCKPAMEDAVIHFRHLPMILCRSTPDPAHIPAAWTLPWEYTACQLLLMYE